jgi:acetoacetyl-CoA synthetase
MADICWMPQAQEYPSSNMESFLHMINNRFNLKLNSYEDLHKWSVENLEKFWDACWDYVGVMGKKGSRVRNYSERMIDAEFFPDGRVNFAECCLNNEGNDSAVVFTQEHTRSEEITWNGLRDNVSSLAEALRRDGLKPGDRVCAVVANVPETVICMLASLAVGAIWSSVSPDFGVEGVLERFSQIQPKLFFHSDYYYNKARLYDVSDRVSQMKNELTKHLPPGCDRLISVSIHGLDKYVELFNIPAHPPLIFHPTRFNDPAFIMFSSGTTGKPKCIVHRHGVILQLMKEHQLHCDIKPGDKVFYYTTTTWMMWNWLVAALASKATILLYEGNPFYPDCNSLFKFVGDTKGTFFGVSAKFIDSVKLDSSFISPPPNFDQVRVIASTGSPLIPESFDFVYSNIKSDVNLASISGGTDILSCFILGCPMKPVKRGFAQCRGLGMDVQIFDPDTGNPLVGRKGELVCCSPFPSQPIGFWNDDENKTKYKEAYFSCWPNVWKHGDFCMLDSDGHVFVYGRSDATLKPGGVRIGTAEIYRAVETLPFIKESICCGIELKPGDESVALFVVLKDCDAVLDDTMRAIIRKSIQESATRHHVPKVIEQVEDIPRTKSGKIVELAVKNILHGQEVKNMNALANPEALEGFKKYIVD